MAVVVTPVRSRLQLRLQIGLDEEGSPKYATRSYANLKPNADNELLYQLGSSLAGLQEHELEAIRRVDEVILEEE